MASSRLVLAQRSLSRRTSGESYRCWTGKARRGEGGGHITLRHKRMENVGGGGGGGGNRNKGKRRQSDQGKNKVTKHRELITSIESEALLLVKGVIAVLDEWTLIRRGRWRGKGVQAVFGRNIKEAKSVTAPPGC